MQDSPQFKNMQKYAKICIYVRCVEMMKLDFLKLCAFIVTFTHNLTNSLRYRVSAAPVPRDFSQFLLILLAYPLLVFQIP